MGGLLLFLGCQRKAPRNPNPLENRDIPSLQLESFSESGDLRGLWLEAILSSRPFDYSFLSASCDKGVWTIEGRDRDMSCLSLKSFFKEPFTLNCEDTRRAILKNPKFTCEKDSDQRLLPYGMGLYVSTNFGVQVNPLWKDFLFDLPSFRWAEAAAEMVSPDLKTWLSSSQPQGLVGVFLSVEANTAEDFKNLRRVKNFLDRSKEPSLFKYMGQLTLRSETALPRRESLKIPLIELSHSYKSGLLKESCDFFGKWIRSRQVLDQISLHSPERLRLHCEIRPFTQASPRNLLLTRLALPLSLRQIRPLPFGNENDFLKIEIYRKLGQP